MASGPCCACWATLTFKLANLADNKRIYALAGYTSQNNTPLYWTIPERSFELDVSAHF